MDRRSAVEEKVSEWMPGSTVQRLWPLKGGMSAESFGIELVDARANLHRVVARFPSPDVHAVFPDAAGQEYQTLRLVKATGLPSPAPLAVFDSPAGRFLLMEYLDGDATAFADDPILYARTFAETLARIHQAEVGEDAESLLLKKIVTLRPPNDARNAALREPEVVDALVAFGDPSPSPSVLLHGDFWPGNALWKDGELSGVVDWENTLLGPALSDVGITRLDMFWAFGREAMEAFTLRYFTVNPQPMDSLPYWDLRAARRPMPNLPEWAEPYTALGRQDVTPERMEAVLLEFIEDGLVALGRRR